MDRSIDFVAHNGKLFAEFDKVSLFHQVARCPCMSRPHCVLVVILVRVSVIVTKDIACALDCKPNVSVLVDFVGL